MLLVAGNVIWLQPEQFHTTRHLRLETFVHLPFSFWKFCFSSLFCFTLLLRTTERYIRGYCVPRKCSCFLSTCRAAPFDCCLANCQRCYVGLHRCYVDTLKLVMYVFASSVCFTRNLARFRKKKFARLRQRLLSLSLKKVIHLFDWLLRLVSWAQCLVFVDWLSDAPEARDSNFPDPVGWNGSTSWPSTNFSIVPCSEFVNFRS